MPWVVGGLRAPGGTSMEASAAHARARAFLAFLDRPPLTPTDPPPVPGGAKVRQRTVQYGGAPSAERVARGGDQARRRRRARSAHTTGAERVARARRRQLACWRS